MQIKEKAVSVLIPYDRNPRKNENAVEAVAQSIKDFGFLVPILIDQDNVIIAGHTRLEAAKKLGLKKVPTITLEDLTEEEARQYRIIDNKTSELSAWNYEELSFELSQIKEFNKDALALEGFKKDHEKEAEEEAPEETTGNIHEGGEIDITDFEDEAFENECPYCGFRW